MTELLEIKIAAIFVIFGIAVAGGMLPRRVGQLERADVWFSLSNAFAGGLFLAVGLIHMAGDAGEHFEEAGVTWEPAPELLLATGGFLLVLLLEMVAGGRLRANLAESLGPVQSLEDDDEPIEAGGDAAFRARILTLLLSVHSFVAGMAIGIEASVAAVIAILVAILAHKGPEGYALGISLYETGMDQRGMLRRVVLYSAMTPLGIVVGAVVSGSLSGDGEALAEAIFDGLAAGTFLYIATFGILKREFSEPSRLVPKFAAALAGVVLIAIVSVWA